MDYYFAHVIELLTETGGTIGDIVKVQAESGAAALDRIVDEFHVSAKQVYLISEEEAQRWAELGVPITDIQEP